MARYRGYIAVTEDGFIARKSGTVDFLDKYHGSEPLAQDYDNFYKTIKTVVSGSTTYEQYLVNQNPYSDKKVFIFSTKDINDNKYNFFNGTPNELDNKLKKNDVVWVMGGANLINQYIEAGLLKRMILTIVPEKIEEGIDLTFPKEYEIEKEVKVGPALNRYIVFK